MRPYFRWLLCIALWAPVSVDAVAAVPAAQRAAASKENAGADPIRLAVRKAVDSALSRPAPMKEPPGASALDFRRDPAVSARVKQQLMQAIGQPDQPNAGLDRMLREFDRLLRGYDYSSRNLADVIAAYLVVTWEVVNNEDSTTQPTGQRAVRRQLVGPLLDDAKILAMTDAQKQEMAERLSYTTMIAAVQFQTLKRNGERARLASFQESARRAVLDGGIDLRQVRLTADGLLKR